MPLYEFVCQKCQHRFETVQKTEDQPPKCPECFGETKRQVSLSSFHLKGGGWASDGYSSGGGSNG
jgi:putative FmdB family regulatory protein